jgi:uncharacterized protein YbjT (DUF2867 family)
MSTVLVTGASGFVGSYVVPALVSDGHRVIGLVRNEDGGRLVQSRLASAGLGQVEVRHGDVTRPETLARALDGVDAVVHLVAIPRDYNGGADLRLVNTEGTRNVVEAARSAGVRRFVHMGAMGVEDDPRLHYASSKAKAEAIVAESGLDWTILKPSLIFGERDGFFNVVAGLVRLAPIVPVPGNGKSRFQPIAATDVARCFAIAVARPEMAGQTYEIGGPRYWTYRQITAAVARAMGKRRLIVPMPVVLIRMVAGISERVRIVEFPVATDQLRQLKLDNIGPLDGVQSAFGFAPIDMEGQLWYLRRKPADQDVLPSAGPGEAAATAG